MGHRGGQDGLVNKPMCCGYQNRNPYPSARRRNNVFLFIIIVITNFRLTGLELEILKLNDERYIIYEANNLY